MLLFIRLQPYDREKFPHGKGKSVLFLIPKENITYLPNVGASAWSGDVIWNHTSLGQSK